MEQKVIKVGNSLAVTLPKQFVEESKVQAGQKVFVDADAKLDTVHISTKLASPRLTPEFKTWLESFNSRYKEALKELAKR